MRVALGTIEIDDETRRKIRKLAGGKGEATRQEVKDYLLTAIENDVVPSIGVEPSSPEPDPFSTSEVSVNGNDEEHALAGAGGSNEELPEPTTRAFP